MNRSTELNEAALAAALQPWVAARKNYPKILGDVLGRALANLPDAYGMESMDLRETLSAFTATVVANKLPAYAKLHAKLVEIAGLGGVHSFECHDRYGMAYCDEPKFKTMAFQTQCLTYMVVLQPTKAYLRNRDDYTTVETWNAHFRICTARRNSLDYARPNLKDLRILTSTSACMTSEYFQLCDGRDRGYLCSVTPAHMSEVLIHETKDMHWGGALNYLCTVLADLDAHASLVDEMVKDS